MRFDWRMRWLLPALVLLFMSIPPVSFGGVLITVGFAPPVLPVYEQPPCPQEGWLWVPGYWAYDDGYYWVPGQWMPAPYVGALWTPPWWGWENGMYVFHDGYWGNEVGYYGGVDYGYGYMGVGFVGGEWRDGAFAYNTAVMRVNTTSIHNTYVNETIVRNNTISNDRHVAFNGGPGGIRHDPTPRERAAMGGRHTAATQIQAQYAQVARNDRASYAKVNGGHPQTPTVTNPAGSANEPRGPARNQTLPHTATPSRNETQPAPEPRPEAHPGSRPETPRAESRPAPAPHQVPGHETRPIPPAPRPVPEHQSAPAPVPRNESNPAPAARPAPQQPEARPAPEPRPEKPKENQRPPE